MCQHLRTFFSAAFVVGMLAQVIGPVASPAMDSLSHLQRAAVFLKAGDYRHAVEACQAEAREAPSV